MVLQPRRGIVRARERSSTALPAFTTTLNPTFQQTAVDRLQITLAGTWRTVPGAGAEATSASEYKELLGTYPAEFEWFRAPENNRSNVKIATRATPNATLSLVEVNVTGWPGSSGTIKCKIHGNPTRLTPRSP